MKLMEKEQAAFDQAKKVVTDWGSHCEDTTWTALVRIVERALQEPEPQPVSVGIVLSDGERLQVEHFREWLDSFKVGGFPEGSAVDYGHKILAILDRETKRTHQTPRVPEPQPVREKLELTEDDLRVIQAVRLWTHWGLYGVSSTSIVDCARHMLAILDRAVGCHPSETPYKPKIVFYDYYAKAMYVDGKLANDPRHSLDCHSAKGVLEILGYEVDIRRVKWEDMPARPANGTKGYYAPETLAELEDHFKNLEARRRQVRIASLKDELQRLEQEDAQG